MPKNIVTVVGTNEFNSSFCALLSQVTVLASQLGTYPPLATSTWIVDSCELSKINRFNIFFKTASVCLFSYSGLL